MCKSYFDHIMELSELASEDDHTMNFLEKLFDADEKWATETESENASDRLTAKANRLGRRKAERKARNRHYECKLAKRNRYCGRKGTRDFDSHPKRGHVYTTDHMLIWTESDTMKAWRNRKESIPMEV